VHDIPSCMLAKQEVLTDFSCLVLTEHASNLSRQVRMGYFCVRLLGYSSRFRLQFLFENIFRSTTASQKLFKIMQTKSNDMSYFSKKVKEFQNCFHREEQWFWKGLVRKLKLCTGRWVTLNNRKTYCMLYYEIDNTIKGQCCSWFSEILEKKFTSFLDFGNFKRYYEKFLGTACQLLLKSYRWYFESLLMKMNFPLFIHWKNCY
jgi:hypothetical protein